jgi:hypothetical protein
MTKPKARNDPLLWLFPQLERHGQPLATRWMFARRLAVNVALGLAIILASLAVGMYGYHRLEGANWLDAFDQAAMILGGMGPYSEPKTDGGKLFAGLYAIYCGAAADRRHRPDPVAGVPPGDASIASPRRNGS